MRRRVLALLLPTLLVGAACKRSEHPESLLLVTLDTTRADRLGCYGWANAGTHALDALAERGVRFDRAYAPVPVTLPSHATLMTGSGPRTHGVRDNGRYRLQAGIETLAEVCARQGMRTAAVVAAHPLRSDYGLDQGFELYEDTLQAPGARATMYERRGELVVGEAAQWVSELEAGEPFFLWVHLFDPHFLYEAPAEYTRAHPDDDYQAEISYADACVATLLEDLDVLGRLEQTLVVVAGDHGEGLGEHGEAFHGYLLHEATARVPLLFAGPGVPRGRVVEAPVGLVDVAPTIAELFDLPAPINATGRSAVELWAGTQMPDRALYLETRHLHERFGWSPLEALVLGDWKLVRAPGSGADRDQLYHLGRDPGELEDLAAREPVELARLRAALDELCAQRDTGERFLARHAPSAEDLQALEALGYGGEALAGVSDAAFSVHPEDGLRIAVLSESGLQLLAQGDLEQADAVIAELGRIDAHGATVALLRGMRALGRAREEPAQLQVAHSELQTALMRATNPLPALSALAQVAALEGDGFEELRLLRSAHVHTPLDARVAGRYEQALDRELRMLEADAERFDVDTRSLLEEWRAER